MNSVGLRLLASAVMAAVLLQAGHGFAQEPEVAIRLDSRTRAALISEINGLLIDQYIFLDVAREMKPMMGSLTPSRSLPIMSAAPASAAFRVTWSV